ILSHAIKQCDINPSLIREVDLGPFKHKQDDGLPLRKASYSCLTAFLTSSSSYPFIANTTLHYLCHNRCQTEEQGEQEITLADLLIKGSQDHEDIQGLCCELLCRSWFAATTTTTNDGVSSSSSSRSSGGGNDNRILLEREITRKAGSVIEAMYKPIST
ncbi:hypothetical protein FOZ63_012319, partial [Perkinsus olseni]